MQKINKIKFYVLTHKIISGIVIVIVLLIGYWGFGKLTSTTGDTRYVTVKASLNTIVVSVSGTGQVSDSNQVDLKAKASGDVTYIAVKNGDKVYAGQLLVQLDSTNAQKTVRDAQASVQNAQLNLQKFEIANATDSLNATYAKAYNDGFNSVANAFIDLPNISNGIQNMIAESSLSDNAARANGQTTIDSQQKAVNSFYDAEKLFEKNRNDYLKLNSNSAKSDIENIIAETSQTVQAFSDVIKNMTNYVNLMASDNPNSGIFSTEQNSLSTYTTTINNDASSLYTATTNIQNAKNSIQNSGIDTQSQQLSLQQAENSLQDAKDTLANYSIVAPFSGTVANLSLNIADSVSSGGAVASVITNKQLANLSFNEIDATKLKVGQKATMTFDAVPDLTISGTVSDIDSIGTVSQGVVTYGVKISFDTQDDRIKPGMSVSAAIITAMKQDVLTVPNSAVKSQGGASYVQMFTPPLPAATDVLTGSISKVPPTNVPVEIGLVNDSLTEIVSGINEGDQVVSRTIAPTATATTTAPSILGSTTGRGATGGVRIPAATTGR